MTSPAFVAAWHRKFADLPTFPARSVLPEMDGDIAWLHDLRRALRAHRERWRLTPLPADAIFLGVLADTGIVPLAMDWPDPAAKLLKQWRAEQ